MGEKQLFEQALSLPASLQPEGFGLSHLGKLGAPMAVIFGNFWYFTPAPAPEDRSYCCYIHWKLCVRIRCSRSSREALCISKVIHYIQFYFFFFPNTYSSYLWHSRQISSEQKTLLPDVACLKENTNYFCFFSAGWIQVIICKTVPGHTAMSVKVFKRRFDLNTSSPNHVSTQAYTSMLSMQLIVVKRTKHTLSVPYTDLSNNECCYKERLQKIWQMLDLLVWILGCFFGFF